MIRVEVISDRKAIWSKTPNETNIVNVSNNPPTDDISIIETHPDIVVILLTDILR